jgi:hypothetical protein
MIQKNMLRCLKPRRLLSSMLAVVCFSAGSACFATAPDTSDLGQSAYNKAEWIYDHATETHYQHLHKPASEQVRIVGSDKCEADADCSGFVSYVLGEVAPSQYELICAEQPGKDYPQAKTFTKFFLALGPDAKSKGWLRLSGYTDLRPGDMIAWEKPINPDAQTIKKGNTGHVMIVAETPGALATEKVGDKTVHFVPIKVLDCSSVSHFTPETLPPHVQQEHRDGLGKGIVRLIVDDDSKLIGYWEGTFSNVSQKEIKHPTYTDKIGLARLVPLER